jgi:quercetin dioxygenase-like cupin family protein
MNAAGSTVLTLPAQTVLRRFRLPGADLFLVVVEGCLRVTDDLGTASSYGPGALVVCPRGRARTLMAVGEPVRLLVVAMPSGPEQSLLLLLGGGAARGEQLQRVADAGIEVLLDD